MSDLVFSITNTEQTSAHRLSSNSSRAKWRANNPAHTRYLNTPTTFVCVDGEGITLPNGEHRYVLLGVGSEQIVNPDGLSWQECFEFLWSQFRTGSVAYTGFFLGYDFVQWFRSMREERARMLLTPTGRMKRSPRAGSQRVQPFPVECEGWEFDILGTKRFKLRKAGTQRWMYICDTGPFFQKSFLAVINPAEWSDPVVTPEEYDTITVGKAARSSAGLDSSMRHYNKLENEILSRILPKLNEGFQGLGISLRPSQWYGPGQAAQEWLKDRAITRDQLHECTPRETLEAARDSYYGGWFEIMAHGILQGTTWEYDINSAYPHIISSLPCLLHGEWVYGNYPAGTQMGRDTGGIGIRDRRYVLVYARLWGNNKHIGAMLHRDGEGSIFRPDRTEGWYWVTELEAAVSAGLISRTDILETWSYRPCDCPPPLHEVRDIYALRRQVGKTTPLGIACKLVPNSLYGKFAQSVGSPKYANPVYASMITSGCRTMILDAIATHPRGTEDVVMVATDGVYFRNRHNGLAIGGALGEWEEGEKENICLFKPGVYWDDKARHAIETGSLPVFKARGFNARDFASSLYEVDRMFKALSERMPDAIEWPTVEFSVSFSMVTAIQALARGKWDTAGTLNPSPTVTQSSDPSLKRENWYWQGGVLRSHPPVNEPYEASHPYDKRMGISDPFGQENLEENGVTPDGLPANLWKEALYG